MQKIFFANDRKIEKSVVEDVVCGCVTPLKQQGQFIIFDKFQKFSEKFFLCFLKEEILED